MKIKLASIDDIETILKLMPIYYEYDHLDFDEIKSRETLHQFFSTSEFGRLWLFTDASSGIVFGYVVITFGYSLEYGGREAFVDELFLLEDYRGKGYGTQAIHFTQKECKKLGLKSIRLEVTKSNPSVIDLYERHGFKDLGRSLLYYKV